MPKFQQAIRPDSFKDIRQVIKDETEKPELIEEKQLARLGEQEGWVVLKAYINNLMINLDEASQAMMERGSSFEDIGKNAVVAQLTKDLLKKVIQKVDDARDSLSGN